MRSFLLASVIACGLVANAAAAQVTPPAAPPSAPGPGSAGATPDMTGIRGGASYTSDLITRWGREVTPQNAWRSYPRPQLTRPQWQNLNGLWDYAIVPATAPRPTAMDGYILVPFAPESRLSGVARRLLPSDRLWYKRSFTVPADWKGQHTLLHFGAVDYEATVWVNGALVGSHEGGSSTFGFDVTDYLKDGANELVVQVADPTSTGSQPRGKQTLEPRGIWYTAVSGIWQTVWLEPVPALHIQEVRTAADIDKGTLDVDVLLNAAAGNDDAVRLTARAGGKVVATALMRGNRRAALAIPRPRLWSPDDPFLYDLTAELVKVTDPMGGTGGPKARPARLSEREVQAYAAARVEPGAARDRVETYFAMRKIAAGPDPKTGRPALLLNGRALFHNGVLDQGWWPESLLTPPSEDAMKSDLLFLRKAGFNMVRKHIKVEPARFYYDADRLGMLIWQDMPSGAFADQSVWRGSDREAPFSSRAAAQYQKELADMIGDLRAFPSIVMWVTNNEGWGQYDARTVSGIARSMDPTRLVNATTGWLDSAPMISSVYDIHTYDEVPLAPEPHGARPLVIGEFGGIGLAEPGHLWFPEKRNRIYQSAADRDDYLRRYRIKFGEIVRQHKELGLAASVYTQTTDVEGEINGLLTYDRAVEKLPPETFAAIAAPLKDAP